jgi:hypothetical protein
MSRGFVFAAILGGALVGALLALYLVLSSWPG